MPSPHAAAALAPVSTPKTVTPRPAVPALTTPKLAAQKPAVPAHPASVKHAFPHIKLYQPESGSVVALGGIEAYYGPRGHAVRVMWSAAEQASANVQLIDDHGTTVSSVNVRGARQSAVLYLPRRFRGALSIQVSSVGKLGDRVAQTTSLPPFGY
jgi:hypothetical protein